MSRGSNSRVALVTGGGTGIGAATARRLADDGYDVVVTGRRRGPIEEVSASTGGHAIVADASDENAAKRVIDETMRLHGRLDLLVLNHGIVHEAPFLETTDQLWNETMAVNLTGPFYLSRAAMPALIKSRGCVVAVASISAVQVWPNTSAYCVSKAGLVMLMQALAFEFGEHGVRANTISPGSVRTPLAEAQVAEWAKAEGWDSPDEGWRRSTAPVPQRRAATPEEIAAAIAWIGSPEASYVNGATLLVDGGQSIVMSGAEV